MGIEIPTIDPLMIIDKIGPASVRRIVIESGSSVNIIFKASFDQMKLEVKDFKPCHATIHDFNGSFNQLVGMVDLSVELRDGDRNRV